LDQDKLRKNWPFFRSLKKVGQAANGLPDPARGASASETWQSSWCFNQMQLPFGIYLQIVGLSYDMN